MALDGMNLNGTNFNAVVRPIYDMHGNEIPAEMGRGVYRDDTREMLSICGRSYKPVQHADVLDPLLQTLKDQGYEIVERNPDKRALYDLAGQRGAFGSVQTQDNGAIMRADVIIGDFIQPTGRSSYLEQGPDTMLRRYTALNSHDGSLAVKVTNGYMRLVCMNGMMDPQFVATTYGKHTANFNTDTLKENILRAADMMENDAETFGKYARTPLTIAQAEDFLKRTMAKLPDKPNGEPHFSEPKLQKLLQQFRREDQTVWGLLQSMTWWATHGDMRSTSGEVTGRLRRDAEVAQTMRSNDFAHLIAA